MTERPPLDTAKGEAPDMAAAELALGLLDGEERAAAMRRVLSEPRFARAVERWRAHLAQLFDLWPEMDAPNLIGRVEASIDRSGDAPVATLVSPKRARAAAWLWPAATSVSSLVAAGLLFFIVTRPPPVPAPPAPVTTAAAPTLVASIDPEAKGVPVTAMYDAQAGAIRLTEAALNQAGRSAELWVIPADGTPHSLGLLHTRGTTALKLSPQNRARIAAGATLAVSIEPVGGSKTGLPTGPVVAKGALTIV